RSDGGGTGSDLGYASSSKSASVDSSTDRVIKGNQFSLETADCFQHDLRNKRDLVETIESSVASGESLISLELGKQTYFEDVSGVSNVRNNTARSSPDSVAKKSKSSSLGTESPRCQGAELMSKYGVGVTKELAISSVDEVQKAIKDSFSGQDEVVVKSHVLAGGCGLQGGVHIVKTDQVADLAGKMLGQILVTKQTGPQEKPVNKLIIACSKRGTSIEDLAEKYPDMIIKVPIDVFKGITDEDAAKVVDGSSSQINPLAETSDNQLVAADAKLNFDENAALILSESSRVRCNVCLARQVAAAKVDLNHIVLGPMVNGAGSAMATMDIIKLHGGTPADFLDVGGSASEHQGYYKCRRAVVLEAAQRGNM
ncbi:hypothetical protein SOVF_111610, partial [Spinacia oleracea]